MNQYATVPLALLVSQIVVRRRHILDVFRMLQIRYPEGCWIPTGLGRALVIFDQDTMKRLLTQHNAIFGKGLTLLSRPDTLGQGLMTSHGARWAADKKTFNHVFMPEQMAGFEEVVAKRLPRLHDELNGPVDLQEVMGRFSLDVLQGYLLPGVGADSGQLRDATAAFLNYIDFIVAVPKFAHGLPLPIKRRFERARDFLNDQVAQMARRLETGEVEPTGLLQTLHVDYLAKGDTAGFRDHLLTLLMVGQETLTQGLGLAVYCLARNPDVQQMLREEIGRDPEAQFADGSLLHRTLRESWRHHAPVPAYNRKALAALEFEGTSFPSGTVFLFPIATMFKYAPHWTEPERFEPDRWIDAPRNANLAFGTGPRACIGGRMAVSACVVTLHALLQHHRFELTDQAPAFRLGVSLRSTNGLWCNVTRL